MSKMYKAQELRDRADYDMSIEIIEDAKKLLNDDGRFWDEYIFV